MADLADAFGQPPDYDPSELAQDFYNQRRDIAGSFGAEPDPVHLLSRWNRKLGVPPVAQAPATAKPPTAEAPDLSSFGKPVDEETKAPDLSQFGTPAEEAQPAPAPAPAPATPGQYVEEAGKGVLAGIVPGVAGAVRAAAIPQAQLAAANQRQLDAMDRIDRGETVPIDQDPVGYQDMTPDQRRAFRAKYEEDARKPFVPAESTPYAAAAAIEKAGKQAFAARPGFEKSYTRGIGETVGGLVAPIVAGAAGTAVGGPVAGVAAAATTMGVSAAGESFEDALQKGATPEQAANVAGLTGIAAGGLGTIPFGAVLRPFALGTRGVAAAILERAVEGGVSFATIGEAQEFVTRQLESATYGPAYVAKLKADREQAQARIDHVESDPALKARNADWLKDAKKGIADIDDEIEANSDYSFSTKRFIANALTGGVLGAALAGIHAYRGRERVPPPGEETPPEIEPSPDITPPGGGRGGGGGRTGPGPGGGGAEGGAGEAGGPGAGAGPAPGARPTPDGTADTWTWKAGERPEPQGPPAEGRRAEVLRQVLRYYGYPEADIRKMSADELKTEVNFHEQRVGRAQAAGERARAEEKAEPPKSPRQAYEDETLRNYGFSDAEIAGMSADDRTRNVEEAIRAGTPHRTEPEDKTGLRGMGAGFAEGATESMYDRIWAKVQAGNVTDLGKPNALLQAAKQVRDAGGLKTRADLKKFAADYAKIERGPDFQQQMRDLVQRHSPARAEPPPPDVEEARDRLVEALREEGWNGLDDVPNHILQDAAEHLHASGDLAGAMELAETNLHELGLEKAQEEGTREDPVDIETPEDIRTAEARAEPPKSPEQAEAGNFKKGHATWNDIPLTIETPAGEMRRGVDEAGKPWAQRMPAAYGYIKFTESAEPEEKLDFYMGRQPASPNVFVIDQVNPNTGKFNEHKVMFGFPSAGDAVQTYLNAFDESGPSRFGALTPMTVDQFKNWMESADFKKAVGRLRSRTGQPEPVLPEPPPEAHAGHVKAVEDALRKSGTRPEDVLPVDIQRAAEIHATEGLTPEEAFVKATVQDAYAQGALTEQQIHDIYEGTKDADVQEIKDEAAKAKGPEAVEAEVPPGRVRPGEAGAPPERGEAAPPYGGPGRQGVAGERGAPEGEQLPGGRAVREGGGREAAEAPGRGEAPSPEAAPAERPVEPHGGERAPAKPAPGAPGERPGVGARAEAPARPAGEPKPAEAAKPEVVPVKRPTPEEVTKEILEQRRAEQEYREKLEPWRKDYVVKKHENITGPQWLVLPKGYREAYGMPRVEDALSRHSTAAKAVAAAKELYESKPKEEEIPGLVERHPGEEDTEVLIVKNSDGKRFNVVLRDKAAGETVGGVRIVNTLEEARAEKDRILKKEKTTAAFEKLQETAAELSKELRPAITLSNELHRKLMVGDPVTVTILQKMGEKAFGGTMAEGKFDRKDLYDALELAINKTIIARPAAYRIDNISGDWREPIEALELLLSRVPKQTVRSEEQQALQQFSTPPTYAAAAVYVAGLRPGDVMLEPSAGTGSIIAAAVRPSVKIVANELSPRRAALIKDLPGVDKVYRENAEQLNNILPADVKPTVVVMNPPFSQTAGRMGDKKVLETGATHVEQALKRLQPGGRLVSIVGGGMGMQAPTFRDWWNKIGKEYNVVANIPVERNVYEKYGTTFPTRVIVIDKVPPTGERPVTEVANSVADLMRLLEPIKNARPQQRPAEPSGAAVAEAEGRPAQPSAPVEPGGLGLGARVRRGLAGEIPVRAPGAGEPPVRMEAGERPGVAPVEPGPTEVGAEGRPAERPGAGRQPVGGGGARPQPDLGKATGTEFKPATGTERIEIENAKPDSQRATEAISETLYEPYRPKKLQIKGAKEHPGPLVESASMASVAAPDIAYQPKLPKKLIENGNLSLPQLEPIVYAGQAHEKMLPAPEGETGKRRGFFIGDGTGVGKGREIAGIILDNFNQGRTKAVWVSEKRKLMNDAKRDWGGLEQDPKLIFDLGKIKPGDPMKVNKGIGFITYDTLKGGMNDQAALAKGNFIRKQKVIVDGRAGVIQRVEKVAKNQEPTLVVNFESGEQETVPASRAVPAEAVSSLKTRIDQIADWVGKDFDGVIAFDESHNMGNAMEQKGKRGKKEAALKALAGLDLQNRLPNARIVYVSATGATEVSNLAYADRLGLWGRGTPFASQANFIGEISQGGIAAMELVARDMKQLGSYMARNLSYEGVEYNRLEHKLDNNQREIYDTLASAWQVVLRNIEKALEITGGANDAKAKSAAKSAFWGGHQRFFNQIITSLQMPSVIKAVKEDIDNGHQVVLQLTNTNEAAQERAAAKAETAEDIEDLDITPKDQLDQLIDKSFPTQQYEEFVDESGNERSRAVVDSEGNPVHNKEALALKEELRDRVASIRVPQGPLDMILDNFGVENVSEVTGRGKRYVLKPDEKTGQRKRVEESRPASANQSEIDAFQDAKKKILVFSEAGGTGASYHADNTTPSKTNRRSHYLVQGGWRADKAVQGFGRTHRTNQASAPIFRLVTTDIEGQKRFISSIARRLAQLGALTKGQRQAGDQGIFSARDNLESTEAGIALRQFFNDLVFDKIEGLKTRDFEQQTGLRLTITDEEGRQTGLLQNPPEITQFLNRMLSMSVDMQNKVFGEFSRRLDDVIEARRQAGKLDIGLETIRGEKIRKDSEQIVHTTPEGAQTKHIKLTVSDKLVPIPFKAIPKQLVQRWVRSEKGHVYAVQKGPTLTDEAGQITDYVRLINPVSGARLNKSVNMWGKAWTEVDPTKAAELWEEEIAKAPEFVDQDLHLVSGAILPVWDRLKGSTRVVRLQTDEGERFLGRKIPNSQISATLKALGAEAKAQQITPEVLHQALLAGGNATLANGWTLQRRLVAGEHRIELKGPSSYSQGQEVKADGVFTERINYDTRYFIPTGPDGVKVIERLTKYRPVTEFDRGGVAQEAEAVGPLAPRIEPRLTPDAEARKADIKFAIEDILNRMLGHHVEVSLEPVESLAGIDVQGWGEQAAADVASGARQLPGHYVRYTNGQALIRLALEHQGAIGYAQHEAWHGVENLLANPREKDILERETPALRRIVADEYAARGEDPRVAEQMAPHEVRAEAYRIYASARDSGAFPTFGGMHLGIRRFFEKVWKFLRAVANAIRRAGFSSAEDIFGAAYEGRMRERSRAAQPGWAEDIRREPAQEAAAVRRVPAPPERIAETRPAIVEERPAPTKLTTPQGGPVTLYGGLPLDRAVKAFTDTWISTFQPELYSERARTAEPLFAQYEAGRASEKDAILRFTEEMWRYWNKMAEPERINFMHDWENGIPPTDPYEQGMWRVLSAALDRSWQDEQRWGSQASYFDEYFPHIWKRPQAARDWFKNRQDSGQIGPNWFQKQRYYKTIQEGLAAGLELKWTNPIDLIVHRLMSGVDMKRRMQLLYGAKSLGLAWEYRQGGEQLVDRGWQVITAPDRRQWVLAPDIHAFWKNVVESKGLWANESIAGAGFRGWMKFKNAVVPVKLALSLFHPLHVAHINYSNGMALAWDELVKGHDFGAAMKTALEGFLGPLQAMAGPRGGHIGYTGRQAWETMPQYRSQMQHDIVQLMLEGGFVPKMSEQLRIAAHHAFNEAFESLKRGEDIPSNIWKMFPTGMRLAIEKVQAPVFEHWIPALKTAAYLNMAQSVLRRYPHLLTDQVQRGVALRAIAKSIDDRFGEMFYGGVMWNRVVKDAAIGSFLSLGWNLGFLRQFGGAAIETVSQPTRALFDAASQARIVNKDLLPGLLQTTPSTKTIKNVTNKKSFALSYVLTSAAILGAMTFVLSGTLRKDDLLDYVFPRDGTKNPDGTDHRLSTMFYTREAFMWLKHVQEQGGNYIAGTREMLWNKLMFQPVKEWWENRDYYGQQIMDPNAPFWKQWYQFGKHLVKEQTPMAYTGAQQATDTRGKVLSYLGFGPAPGYLGKTALENRIGFLYGEFVAPKSKPFDEEGIDRADWNRVRSNILNSIRTKNSQGLQDALKEGRKMGMSNAYLKRLESGEPTAHVLFKRLPDVAQMEILRRATQKERQEYMPIAKRMVRAKMANEFTKAQRAAQPPVTVRPANQL